MTKAGKRAREIAAAGANMAAGQMMSGTGAARKSAVRKSAAKNSPREAVARKQSASGAGVGYTRQRTEPRKRRSSLRNGSSKTRVRGTR